MCKISLIISLNFNPGHVSHMVASYKQCEELGYVPYYYVTNQFTCFLPKGSRMLVYGKDVVSSCALAIFLFPAKGNLKVIYNLKRHFGSKIIYIFHEPLGPMKIYRKAGFTYSYLAKLWIINRISALTVKWSDVILLPSNKAVQLYESNRLYKNKNYYCLPLLFDDENTDNYSKIQRQYFSYIGTVAADHSFNEYISFVENAIAKNMLSQLRFLIATKSEFEVPQVLKESPRVVIKKGEPLSNEVINEYYSSTYVVWNAYARTTQSGVLAKSFMFGTPAILLRKNLSEFTKDEGDVVAIDDNTSTEQIFEAVNKIVANFNEYSISCRKRFEECFYYRKYNARFKEILSSL